MAAVSLPSWLEAIAAGWIPDPGEPVAVELDHADECALWYGAPCNCEPRVLTVSSRRPPRRAAPRSSAIPAAVTFLEDERERVLGQPPELNSGRSRDDDPTGEQTPSQRRACVD